MEHVRTVTHVEEARETSDEPRTRRYGNAVWDAYLRSTGVLASAGIGLILVVPGSAALVGLAIYTLWVTGPLSPLFPIGLEPVVMLFGRLYPPLVAASVVTGAGLYVEYLSYHLYGAALRHRAARRLRESSWLARLRVWFERAPFATVWVTSWAPLPYWGVRVLAALTGYPMGRYLSATLLGRLPKFWLFAALGLHWNLPAGFLVAVVVVGTVVSLVVLLARR